jgi:hypothetical protein
MVVVVVWDAQLARSSENARIDTTINPEYA